MIARGKVVVAAVVVAVIALPTVASAPPAAAGTKQKPLNPCSLMTIDEIQTLFEQPFRDGSQETGGGCVWRRKPGSDDPDVVVTILAKRYATVKRAKARFTEATSVTTELSAGIERLPKLADEAFTSQLIGAQLLVMRQGKVVAEIRIDQNDDPEAVFRDQALAVATTALTHLAAA